MWKWMQEILDRQDSIRERKLQHELDLRHCNSCEVLQLELNHANQRELELLKLIQKPEQEIPHESIERHLPLTTKIPWNVKRQQLERASRKTNGTPKPKEITVDNLDDELDEIRGK